MAVEDNNDFYNSQTFLKPNISTSNRFNVLGCLSMDPSSQNSLSDWNAGIFSVPHEELENTHDASELDTKQEKRNTIDALNLDQVRSALGLL